VPADDEPGVAGSAAVARLAIAHLGAACAQQLRLRAAPAWRHYRRLRSVVPATLHEWVIGARTLALEQFGTRESPDVSSGGRYTSVSSSASGSAVRTSCRRRPCAPPLRWNHAKATTIHNTHAPSAPTASATSASL